MGWERATLSIMPLRHVVESNIPCYSLENEGKKLSMFKGIVSFDRSDISAHQERVLLLLKVRFRIEFFNFHVRR
jgi:hypothetical protein